MRTSRGDTQGTAEGMDQEPSWLGGGEQAQSWHWTWGVGAGSELALGLGGPFPQGITGILGITGHLGPSWAWLESGHHGARLDIPGHPGHPGHRWAPQAHCWQAAPGSEGRSSAQEEGPLSTWVIRPPGSSCSR